MSSEPTLCVCGHPESDHNQLGCVWLEDAEDGSCTYICDCNKFTATEPANKNEAQ